MGSILTHKKKNEVDLGEMPAENTFDLNWVVWEASIARHKGKNCVGGKWSSLHKERIQLKNCVESAYHQFSIRER